MYFCHIRTEKIIIVSLYRGRRDWPINSSPLQDIDISTPGIVNENVRIILYPSEKTEFELGVDVNEI